MRSKFLTAGLALVMLMGLLVSTVTAGSVTILYDAGKKAGQSTGIVMTSPDTYGSCRATSDVIKTTGVGGRLLKGKVLVEYVTGNSRVLVPGGRYVVNQTGDLNLTVAYPPVSDWPSNEIHVTIQIELYENGYKVASLGGYQGGRPPGNGWDVYCNRRPTPTRTATTPGTSTPTTPPTATPSDTPTTTPTATPSDTPTTTPTATPSDTPTTSPTATPTATPSDTPTTTPTATPSDTPTTTPTATPSDTPTTSPTVTPTTPASTGCTPGYWKQPQHVDSWPAPYTTETTFYQAFGVGSSSLTLLEALDLGGAGKNALMRHATAALLNATADGVDYPYTAEQVIAMVRQAYATGAFEVFKDPLAAANEAGCPLD